MKARREPKVVYVQSKSGKLEDAASRRTPRQKVLRTLAVLGVMASIALAAAFVWYRGEAIFEVHHAPSVFDRRGGDLTANVTGVTSRAFKYLGSSFRYRLNDGPWHPIEHLPPRTPWPQFTIELSADELRDGANTVELRAEGFGGAHQEVELGLRYDPSPIVLPLTVDWADAELIVDDGWWETFQTEGMTEARVRPRPGHEVYDKVLLVTGAIAGGRRVETDVIYRGRLEMARPYGFGVMPLWGGRPDDEGVRFRGGWSYGLAWYLSTYLGVGNEFGFKHGGRPRRWVNQYRDLDLLPGQRYRVIAEAWPEREGTTDLRWHQRMKWWADGEDEPEEWLELDDEVSADLPAGEYAVGLLSFWAPCDFGPVTVTALDTPAPSPTGDTADPTRSPLEPD